MASQHARSIDRTDLPLSPPAPLPVVAVIAGIADAANPSPVAMLHHRIEAAALQGFFDKKASRKWHGRHRHVAIVVGTVAGIWTAVFATIWAWVY